MEENDMVGGGRPSEGTHSSRESQNIDTGRSLMNSVEISFICSFCLVWQLICSGKSTVKERNFSMILVLVSQQRNLAVMPATGMLQVSFPCWFLKYLYLGKNEVQRLDGMCSYCLIQSTASPWNTLYLFVLSLILLALWLASRKEVMFVNSGGAVLICLVLGRREWDLWVIELIGQAVDCFLLLPHKWGWLYPQKELGQIELRIELWPKQYVR